jgi:hypothetical protein
LSKKYRRVRGGGRGRILDLEEGLKEGLTKKLYEWEGLTIFVLIKREEVVCT